MKKNISEDLPARSYPQAQVSDNSAKNTGKKFHGGDNSGIEKTPEKRIRQAIYDIRYRSRRENIPIRTAYSQFMQNSSMSEQEKAKVREKLFGAGGMQAENFEMDMKEGAAISMANALYRVFVEDNQKTINEDELKREFNRSSGSVGEKKFKVFDPDSGVAYVRYASRSKINNLRLRGLDVEMTEYGDPYEGERSRGEQTASVLRGRAKKDYDGDGKVESPAKEYRGVVHNAIQRKRGLPADGKDTSSVKENFIGEVSKMENFPTLGDPKSTNSRKTIDVLPPERSNVVKINPTNTVLAHTELSGDFISENGYSKFIRTLSEKKMTKKTKKIEKKLKKKYDPSGMKQKMIDEYGEEKGKQVYFATIRKSAMKEESDCESSNVLNIKPEEDSRSMATNLSLSKLPLRYRGVKNPQTVVLVSDK